MNASQSKDIDSKTKQKLIEQALFMKENSSLYLELNNINENGKIVTRYNNIQNSIDNKIVFSSLDSIKASIETTKKTGVLVSCSHRRAGGGWLSGSFAQEESVSRASTWALQAAQFKSWYKEDSWLGQKGALVIDGLLICDENGNELKEAKKVVFAGVAAANKASLNDDDYWHSIKGITERQNKLIERIVCSLQEFDKRGVEDVVLCAFGTNVFGWSLEESIYCLHQASKYVSNNMNLICALGSESKLDLAQKIYCDLLSSTSHKKLKSNKF